MYGILAGNTGQGERRGMTLKGHMRYIVLLVGALLSMSGATLPVSSINTRAALTPEGEGYIVATTDAQLTVRNTGSGGNNREIYWDDHAPDSPNAVQCATWTSGSDVAQHGFAFRIARQSGGYNAIVFARNIWLRQYWVFAPKLFHTGSDYAYERVSSPDVAYLPQWDSPVGIDLSAYLGRGEVATYPLRVCASLDTHDVLRFAVAKTGDSMPPLDHPGIQGGSWQLDIAASCHAGEGRTGKNGGVFVGHIPVGTTLGIEHLTLNGRPAVIGL